MAIGEKNKYNKKLSELAATLFNSENADSYYFIEKKEEAFSKIEIGINRKYSVLYN
ncbi:hypothetical protein [Polaribacter sp. IC073]|uniref:hypothetical protein n=1 Tax=Polaribacter sp. IC073 TaxID=2508540 RepID=UPI0016770C22|nr:hypothetical protein [Polaribacter sp. IC073]